MWNSQYRIYLATLTWVWFVNSVPGLLLFFLRYCLHLSESAAEAAYTMCLAAFIFTGFCALPCIPKIISSKGKKYAASVALLGLVVLGPIFFTVSYIDKVCTMITLPHLHAYTDTLFSNSTYVSSYSALSASLPQCPTPFSTSSLLMWLTMTSC
jgi:Na+/melibiose symporter-like transporter